MRGQRWKSLSTDDLRTIMKASADAPERAYLFMLLMILTGQRAREVAMLEWNDIDLEASIWNRNTRSKNLPPILPLPLSSFASNLLHDARSTSSLNESRVFCSLGGEENFLSSVRRNIRRHLDLYERTPTWTIHMLRWTFAEGCYRLGASSEILYFILAQRDPEAWRQVAPNHPERLIIESRPILEAWSNHIFNDVIHSSARWSDFPLEAGSSRTWH